MKTMLSKLTSVLLCLAMLLTMCKLRNGGSGNVHGRG